ncbi:MAG: transcription antitermination factor NusB [Clostridia bacterium]|nr:transcription antitermination factor NusB [Clostridia bacterium]
MSRKTAREVAFKIIFASNFQNEEITPEDMLDALLKETENHDDVNSEDMNYVKDVVHGVYANMDKLDDLIKEHLKGWTMDRICKTDLAILRLAIYEILHRDDIPYKVTVNEAVELAKSFSEDNSPSFVNGILAEIINAEGMNE